jgi:hypothetical protein
MKTTLRIILCARSGLYRMRPGIAGIRPQIGAKN